MPRIKEYGSDPDSAQLDLLTQKIGKVLFLHFYKKGKSKPHSVDQKFPTVIKPKTQVAIKERSTFDYPNLDYIEFRNTFSVSFKIKKNELGNLINEISFLIDSNINTYFDQLDTDTCEKDEEEVHTRCAIESIIREDWLRLINTNWLNDNIINFWMTW